MAFQPLTREQYESAKRSGFSDSQILEFEQKRKADEETGLAAPKPKKGIGGRIMDAANAVTDFIGARGIADQYGASIARMTAKDEQTRNLVENPSLKEVAGSALQTGANFIPVGRVASLATKGIGAVAPKIAAPVQKTIGAITGGVTVGGTYDVGEKLQTGETSGAGTMIGAGLPLVPPALKGLGRLATESLGVSTGVGGGVTRKIFDAARTGGADAQVAKDALRGGTSPEAIVDNARNALGTIIQNRTTNYQKALATLKTQDKSLNVRPVFDALNNNLEKFGVTLKNGVLDFSRSAIRFDKTAQKDIETIVEEMKQFGTRQGDRTPVGVDSLKRAFDDLYTDSSNVRAFVASMRDSARKILSQVDGYDKMAKDYGETTGLIKEIQKGLSLGNKAQTDTAFRKLAGALRVNNEFRRQLVQELDDVVPGEPISSQIAGQQMSELLPRGLMRQISGVGAVGGILTGVGMLPILKAAVFTSPRVVGELLMALGVGKRHIDRVIEYLKTSAPEPADALFQGGLRSPISNMNNEE